jgi:hypothetical protein
LRSEAVLRTVIMESDKRSAEVERKEVADTGRRRRGGATARSVRSAGGTIEIEFATGSRMRITDTVVALAGEAKDTARSRS